FERWSLSPPLILVSLTLKVPLHHITISTHCVVHSIYLREVITSVVIGKDLSISMITPNSTGAAFLFLVVAASSTFTVQLALLCS
ncbi:unnamed protein product, partial [Urochloa humidicola]